MIYIKGKTDSTTVIVGGFNTPLISVDRSSREKINKETAALNGTVNQMDLIDSFRVFHPKAAEYTFCFTNVQGTFFMIDHVLSYKTILN